MLTILPPLTINIGYSKVHKQSYIGKVDVPNSRYLILMYVADLNK